MSAKLVCPRCQAEYPVGYQVCLRDGADLCEPSDLVRIGCRFASYEIESILGVGGMGVVYKGVHAVLAKPVAIKILSGRHGQRADASEEMLREAQAASRIRHPHIVDISDFGTTPDGAAYFVMEYLEGQSLGRVLARHGPLPIPLAHAIVRQVASAVGAAHAVGIIHRDLKPENIFLLDVRGSGPSRPLHELPPPDQVFVKILDFGLAKAIDMGPSSRTRDGMLAGTPWYMSPEQAKNKPVDPRSDIYSLGIVLYQIVTGELPFEGESAVEIFVAHLTRPVVPPREKRQGLDEATNALILSCLDKDPDKRPRSMDEVVAALDPRPAGAASAPKRAEAARPAGGGEGSGESAKEPASPSRMTITSELVESLFASVRSAPDSYPTLSPSLAPVPSPARRPGASSGASSPPPASSPSPTASPSPAAVGPAPAAVPAAPAAAVEPVTVAPPAPPAPSAVPPLEAPSGLLPDSGPPRARFTGPALGWAALALVLVAAASLVVYLVAHREGGQKEPGEVASSPTAPRPAPREVAGAEPPSPSSAPATPPSSTPLAAEAKREPVKPTGAGRETRPGRPRVRKSPGSKAPAAPAVAAAPEAREPVAAARPEPQAATKSQASSAPRPPAPAAASAKTAPKPPAKVEPKKESFKDWVVDPEL
jgi:eukaryotic-like serine/threonine-protein kinase